LAAIADRLGLDLFGDGGKLDGRDEASVYSLMLRSARVTFDDLVAAGKHGLPTPLMVGWFHEKVLGERPWRIAPAVLLPRLAAVQPDLETGPVLVAARVSYATNSVLFPSALRKSQVPPEIHISLDLAKGQAVEDGALISIATEFGELSGPAKVDTELPPGSVWMSHGWTRRNVNRLIGSREIDGLTTQPYFSAIPVKVRNTVE
jgi:anaerobic selenocysteine-containing dehydrogenase